jgi:hypothetical protein
MVKKKLKHELMTKRSGEKAMKSHDMSQIEEREDHQKARGKGGDQKSHGGHQMMGDATTPQLAAH